MDKFEALDIPQCKYCGDIARPNILNLKQADIKLSKGNNKLLL